MLNSVQNVNIASNSTHKPKKSQGCEFITTDTNLIGNIQEDAFTTAQKENKKKKIAKYSIIGAVGITVAGAILGGSFLARGSFKKFSNFINKKFGTQGKDFIENIGNVSINVNNSKDAYLKKYLFNMDPLKHPKFLDKHPKLLSAYTSIKKIIAKPFKKIDDWSSNLYKKAAESTISQGYKRLGKKIQKTDSLLAETLKNIPESELGKKITINGIEKTVSEWVDDLGMLTKKQSSTLEANFGKKARERLYAQMDQATKKVDQSFRKTFEEGLKHKESKGNLFKFIAEDAVKGEKATMTGKINSKLSSLTNQGNTGCSDEIGKIVDGLAENGIIDSKVHKKIASKLTDIKDKMTKNAEMIAEDAFDKFRDINMGCAPADVLMTTGEIGLLGLHASQAKNKEERTSVVLTTAVPLGLGIAGTTWATLKMVSGIKSLLLGGAITLVSGIIGKSIDKIYRKNHSIEDEKPSIATLELPKEIQEGAIAKTVDRVIEKVAGQ